MAKSDSGSGFALFTGIVVGGLIGAAAGLLLAPNAGDKTRRVLKRRLNEMSKEAQVKWQEIEQEKIQPAITEVKTKAELAVEEVKGKVEQRIDAASDEIQTNVKNIQKEVASRTSKEEK